MTYKHDKVVRAWLDGKIIQIKTGDGWKDISTTLRADTPYIPSFGTGGEFRIKPEPQLIYVFIRKGDGSASSTTSDSRVGEQWKRHSGVAAGTYAVLEYPNPYAKENNDG